MYTLAYTQWHAKNDSNDDTANTAIVDDDSDKQRKKCLLMSCLRLRVTGMKRGIEMRTK